jgi:transcriptional regulator with XRE-family HTH domain
MTDRVSSKLSHAIRQCVQELRRDREWTQAQLATEIGVTQSAVSYLLSGGRRQHQLDLWADIAQGFGLSLSELIAQAEARLAAERSAIGAPSEFPNQQSAPPPERSDDAPDYDQLADVIAARVLRGLHTVMQPDREQVPATGADRAAVRGRVRRGRRKSA